MAENTVGALKCVEEVTEKWLQQVWWGKAKIPQQTCSNSSSKAADELSIHMYAPLCSCGLVYQYVACCLCATPCPYPHCVQVGEMLAGVCVAITSPTRMRSSAVSALGLLAGAAGQPTSVYVKKVLEGLNPPLQQRRLVPSRVGAPASWAGSKYVTHSARAMH